MADKRPQGAAEALILTTPPLTGLLMLIFRRYPLATNQTLFVASIFTPAHLLRKLGLIKL
jgi:hypothetical protein